MTLTEWLLEQVAEDERLASDEVLRLAGESFVASPFYLGDAPGNPARVLAECAAKRQIIELHLAGHRPGDDRCWYCQSDCRVEHGEAMATWETWPCPTLRIMASVYADRPGFQPEWAV